MSISNIVKEFSFFQIYVTADLEHEGKIYPNVKQFNNDSILTIDNWEQNKDMFFCQRMERYNPSLTVKEKILLELETLEKIPISQTGFKILKERYREYLTDNSTKIVKDYKDTLWFRTGVFLATGEAFELYHKYKNDKGHFNTICLELGFKKSDRPYFSATIQDNIGDKNTFADKYKLQKLHDYLTEKKLTFGVEFLEKYGKIVP